MITITLDSNNENRAKDEAVIREHTKDILGIRYRTGKNGEFIAYSTFITEIQDIFKIIRRKIKNG